jgi:hypothetical protein
VSPPSPLFGTSRLAHPSQSEYGAIDVLNTISPLLMLHKISSPSATLNAPPNQHTKMFPKSLAPQIRGPSFGLLAALSVCLVMNLGALFFSLHILTRGTWGYSVPYPCFSSHS